MAPKRKSEAMELDDSNGHPSGKKPRVSAKSKASNSRDSSGNDNLQSWKDVVLEGEDTV